MIETMYNTGNLILSGVDIREPDKIKFTNSDEASEMFHQACDNINGGRRSKIIVHADVDFDGVASAYIAQSVCEYCVGRDNTFALINAKRTHGLTEELVTLINGLNRDIQRVELLIVVDSSTNSQELLRKLTCDCIVIDHHELEVPLEEMTGDTTGGKYVIINNEIDHIPDFSGAEVVYEWFRFIGFDAYVKMKKLYGWVAVSLFSDIINGDNERNQWFIQRAIDKKGYDETLQSMFNSLYKGAIGNKTDISFSLVPLVNAAIRTGHNAEMLDLIFRQPEKINTLRDYKTEQSRLVDIAISPESKSIRMREYPDLIIYDTTDMEGMIGFEGLIANKLMTDNRKTSIVYACYDYGIKGSFRLAGRYTRCGLREALNNIEGFKASGHSDAFGIEVHSEDAVEKLVSAVIQIADAAGMYENNNSNNTFHREAEDIMTFDDLVYYDVYTEAGMRKLITSHELAAMAQINAHISGNKKALIRVPNTTETVKVISEYKGKYTLKVLGLECITFNEVRENFGYIWLYPEINKCLTVYVDGVRL